MSTKLLAGALAALTFGISSSARATNVLVIIVDDAAVDKIGAYAADYPGYSAAAAYLPDTQTIDSLATAGLRFTRAWATPLCSPTRAALQTGLYPFKNEVGTALGHNAPGLEVGNFLMLAESFANQGYKTGHFGKWHIGTKDANGVSGQPATSPFFVEPHPSLAGFDRFFGIYDGYPGAGRNFDDWPRVGWLSGGTGYAADETANLTDRTSAVAVSWINQQSSDWLAVVSFSAPHSPDTASSSWQYGDADPTRYRSAGLSCLATNSCGDEARAVYQGLAEHVDLEIESLLNGIDPAELDDTLIVLFGDNGTPIAVQEGAFNVAGRGKGSVYENGVRVPLIVADGGTWRTGAAGMITSPGRTVDAAVHVLDIYQTIHQEVLSLGVIGVDSTSFGQCFTNTGVYCGWVGKRYGYTETHGAGLTGAKIAVRYGHDKMVATYNSALGCLDNYYYETDLDPFETATQAWGGTIRADRLKDHFVNLHTPVATSWAYSGGALVGFCNP